MIDELKQKLQAEVERLNHEITSCCRRRSSGRVAHGDLRENSAIQSGRLERQHS